MSHVQSVTISCAVHAATNSIVNDEVWVHSGAALVR